MADQFKVACVQTNSTPDVGENIAAVSQLIRDAANAGADFIITPENVLQIEPDKEKQKAAAQTEDSHVGLAAFRALAAETGVWLMAGSLSVRLDGVDGDDRMANRSYLIAPDGQIAASYDKIHMFDVQIGDGQTYRESHSFRPGANAVLADLPWGKLGMTVCYDLRFPHLHRSLAKAGASFLTVPAAFTEKTGEAHWHVLLRARAIETGCFVFACAQTGTHAAGRRTYGHSLIIAPWGEVLADAGQDVGFVMAEIDPAKVDEARGMVPALTHDRDFTLAKVEVAAAAE